MINALNQQKHYNKKLEIQYEKYLSDPNSLKGISLPMSYSKYIRLTDQTILNAIDNHFSKKILELGCGTGEWSCYLASKGADIIASDISKMNTNITQLRAERNNLKIKVRTLDCTNTNLPNKSFDLVFGIALIHHLTVEQENKLYLECYRILKDGGISVFLEPLSNSKTLNYIRTLIPIFQKHNPRPSRLSKAWNEYRLMEKKVHPDRPNTSKHYKEILTSTSFSDFDMVELGIFNRLDRLTINKRFRKMIHDIDYKVQTFIPLKTKLYRNIIIKLIK